MHDDKTVNLLYLITVLQTAHGPYPLGRAALLTWLSAELEKTPGDAGVQRLIADYPAHLAGLKTP